MNFSILLLQVFVAGCVVCVKSEIVPQYRRFYTLSNFMPYIQNSDLSSTGLGSDGLPLIDLHARSEDKASENPYRRSVDIESEINSIQSRYGIKRGMKERANFMKLAHQAARGFGKK